MAKQLHKRFTKEQVRDIVGKFVDRKLWAKETYRFLGIGRTRLHHLVTIYRKNPDTLDISYTRISPTNSIDASIKKHILTELAIEKEKIIDNPAVPTNHYNYSYLQKLIWENMMKGLRSRLLFLWLRLMITAAPLCGVGCRPC